MFADDLLLLGKASGDQMDVVMEVLDTFCTYSGQVVSAEKTSILFSKNVTASLRRQLVLKSGFRKTSNLGKYLGISLTDCYPRTMDYQYLIDKVRNKLSG